MYTGVAHPTLVTKASATTVVCALLPSIHPVHHDDMSTIDDAPPPPPARLSDDAIKGVVRDLNKKEKFEEACLVIHAQVTHHSNPSPPEGLFAAVLRVGTVLKTRHAEGSAAWKFGLRLFKDAVAGGGFNGRSVDKLQDLLNAALAATDAADAEPENAGDGVDHDESGGDGRARAARPGGRATAGADDRPTSQAFEGQLSGDLASEFDRQRRTGIMGRANRGPQLDAVQLMMNGIREPNDESNSVSEGGLEELIRNLVSAAAASGSPDPGGGGGGGGEAGGGGDSRDPAELRRRLEEWVRSTHPESAQAILRALRRIETVAAAAANDDDNDDEDVVDEATMERLAAAADAATRAHRSVGKSHPHSTTKHRNCFFFLFFFGFCLQFESTSPTSLLFANHCDKNIPLYR